MAVEARALGKEVVGARAAAGAACEAAVAAAAATALAVAPPEAWGGGALVEAAARDWAKEAGGVPEGGE